MVSKSIRYNLMKSKRLLCDIYPVACGDPISNSLLTPPKEVTPSFKSMYEVQHKSNPPKFSAGNL